MGLRNRGSAKRIQKSQGEDAQPKSSPQHSPKTQARRKNSSMKLVSSEPRLDSFLDPEQDFEAFMQMPLPQEASPSRVQSAVETLGKLEVEVIAALFPASGEPPATLEEVAKSLGMSVEEVKNIADEALRGLRGLRPVSQRVSKAWN
jgi:Sigma-70, region 4